VFDIDGTLVDSRASITAAVREAWLAMGLAPPAYDDSRKIVGLSLNEAVQVLAPEADSGLHDALAEAYKNAFHANRQRGMNEPLYAGAREALDGLKADGWALGVATGKARRGLDFILDHHRLAAYFDAAFCADDGPGKPHPHMLHLNMRTLDLGPERTVMIGDTSHDMIMARAAGAYALGVDWGFHTSQEINEGGAHEVVSDFAAMGAALGHWRSGS